MHIICTYHSPRCTTHQFLLISLLLVLGVQLRNVEFSPGGLVRFGRCDVGDNAMILDRSVCSPGTTIEDNVMVGSLTCVTKDTQHNSGCCLMGNPALNMIRLKGDVEMEIVGEPMVSDMHSHRL